MKSIKLLSVAAFCITTAMLLSSCGIMKNNDFSSKKYTHFKKGESTVTFNSNIKEMKATNLFSEVPEKNEVTESATIAAVEPSQEVMTSTPEIKNETGKTVSHINFIPEETKKIKQQHAISLGLNRPVNKPNTTSVNDDDVNLILLVILAIILPPLAVFLVRGIGGAFWLDILLCIFFWLPGIIYALFVIFD